MGEMIVVVEVAMGEMTAAAAAAVGMGETTAEEVVGAMEGEIVMTTAGTGAYIFLLCTPGAHFSSRNGMRSRRSKVDFCSSWRLKATMITATKRLKSTIEPTNSASAPNRPRAHSTL